MVPFWSFWPHQQTIENPHKSQQQDARRKQREALATNHRIYMFIFKTPAVRCRTVTFLESQRRRRHLQLGDNFLLRAAPSGQLRRFDTLFSTVGFYMRSSVLTLLAIETRGVVSLIASNFRTT